MQMDEVRYLTVKELPLDERPRERLKKRGASELKDSELLAIALHMGFGKTSALELAGQLLKDFNGLKGIANLTFDELCKIKGIGDAKAAQILASFELGNRAARIPSDNRRQIKSSNDVKDLLWDKMRKLDKEHFAILLLDTKNRVIRDEIITMGILDSSLVHPREVFKNAIKSGAASVIIVHNHPSGDPAPSRDDMATTKRLCEAGQLVGINVLDHVIIGESTHYSFKDESKI
jgi:DNA repair protein RadC